MTKADLKAVPDVDIDEGVFKYVYIRYVDSSTVKCDIDLLLLTSQPFCPQGVL